LGLLNRKKILEPIHVLGIVLSVVVVLLVHRPRPPRPAPRCGLFSGVRGRGQPVEKVGVVQVGGSREFENRTKTPQLRRIRSLDRGPMRARRSFSTGWCILGSTHSLSLMLSGSLMYRTGSFVVWST
jgi:hypothetical protein